MDCSNVLGTPTLCAWASAASRFVLFLSACWCNCGSPPQPVSRKRNKKAMVPAITALLVDVLSDVVGIVSCRINMCLLPDSKKHRSYIIEEIIFIGYTIRLYHKERS